MNTQKPLMTSHKSDVTSEDISVNENSSTADKHIFQYVVAFSSTLMLLSSAVAYGWTSPTLPILLSDTSPIPITLDESSWIVVAMVVGAVLSLIPTVLLMDKLGRKIALLLGALPLIVSWILIAFADSVTMLYISRLLSGLSYGMSYSITPMYLGEIASDAIRGSITTLLTVMAKTGILYAFAIGPYVSIYTMAWIGVAPALIFLATFIWLPESPYFLLGKRRNEAALKSLQRLRGHDAVQPELRRMEVAVRKSEENKGTWRELVSPGVRRSLLITIGLGGIQQLSGSQAIIAYAQQVFEKVGSDLGASESAIILAVVQLVSAVVATYVVDKINRRPMLIMSVCGAAISNTLVGLYFFLIRMEVDVSDFDWLAIVAIMAFIICYTLGLATVTFAVLGEIFPKNLRALAGCVFTINAAIIGFAVGKLFQVVSDGLGSDVTFWGFAVFCYLFVPFIWFLIPETRSKSLDVILDLMKSGKIQ